MLQRNLQLRKRYFNGARHIVESMSENIVFLRDGTGNNIVKCISIPHVPCNPGDDSLSIVVFDRTHFLIRVFYSSY